MIKSFYIYNFYISFEGCSYLHYIHRKFTIYENQ